MCCADEGGFCVELDEDGVCPVCGMEYCNDV